MSSSISSSLYEVDSAGCLIRQQRLLAEMERLRIDLVVLTRPESIQWLTGAYFGPLFKPTAAIDSRGEVTLVLPSRKVESTAIAGKVLGYEEKWLSTMRDASDQQAASLAALLDSFGTTTGRAACEFSHAPLLLTRAWAGDWVDVDSMMFRLRRKKEADELRMLRRANEANKAMYAKAREIIEPGLNELDLYNALHNTAVSVLDEPLTYQGQDYRSNARGGPPRDRQAVAGELWILDLGVGFRGYYSDNARTIAVDGSPTDAQQRAWEMILPVFDHVLAAVKPGKSCQQLFEEAKAMLAPAEPWLFNHHLGHGVGLAPHEGPHLNPNWDDTFEAGDFFAVEPGLYHEELCTGMRLEQNYVVTESGVELLTDWPLELA